MGQERHSTMLGVAFAAKVVLFYQGKELPFLLE